MCPPEKLIKPCICEDSSSLEQLTCSNVTTHQLHHIFHSISKSNCTKSYIRLYWQSQTFHFLPFMFENLTFETVDLSDINSSPLPSDIIFEPNSFLNNAQKINNKTINIGLPYFNGINNQKLQHLIGELCNQLSNLNTIRFGFGYSIDYIIKFSQPFSLDQSIFEKCENRNLESLFFVTANISTFKSNFLYHTPNLSILTCHNCFISEIENFAFRHKTKLSDHTFLLDLSYSNISKFHPYSLTQINAAKSTIMVTDPSVIARNQEAVMNFLADNANNSIWLHWLPQYYLPIDCNCEYKWVFENSALLLPRMLCYQNECFKCAISYDNYTMIQYMPKEHFEHCNQKANEHTDFIVVVVSSVFVSVLVLFLLLFAMRRQ